MNPRALALPALVLFAAATPLASGLASPPRAAEVFQGHDEDETKLAEIMEGIRADLKQLGKQIEAKDQAAAWKSVCSLQKRLLEAKQESPEKAKSMAEADRPAFVCAFRARLAGFLKATCDLETAVLGGEFEAAEKVNKEVIWPMQKPAHKEFRND